MANAWNEILPGLWRSTYSTKTNIASNSFALRLSGGELAVISPRVEPDAAFFAETEALGRVTALVAPNSGHDLGQAAWQARYPDAGVYAPAAAIPVTTEATKSIRSPDQITVCPA